MYNTGFLPLHCNFEWTKCQNTSSKIVNKGFLKTWPLHTGYFSSIYIKSMNPLIMKLFTVLVNHLPFLFNTGWVIKLLVEAKDHIHLINIWKYCTQRDFCRVGNWYGVKEWLLILAALMIMYIGFPLEKETIHYFPAGECRVQSFSPNCWEAQNRKCK